MQSLQIMAFSRLVFPQSWFDWFTKKLQNQNNYKLNHSCDALYFYADSKAIYDRPKGNMGNAKGDYRLIWIDDNWSLINPLLYSLEKLIS